ncbi:MAG: hypothetical protein ACREV9_05480 [Burkholderiales bacterium]
MQWGIGAIILLLIAIGVGVSSRDPAPPPPLESPEPRWAINPKSPGSNLPPQGRSLFDVLLAQEPEGRVPFPFSALLKTVERYSPKPKVVLIPLSRSLQRTAAAPDFFAWPRIVAAAAGESDGSALFLKDRFFLGYNEKAETIEVISYNDAAGRFEFQIVKDYREGAKPQVFYANRAVCISCHQNAGPIFSRPLWDETNSNAKIAAKLGETVREFHGIPVERGIDTPNEIDDATDRANLFSLYQLLWREGCEDEACRGDLLLDILQYRLSGRLNVEKWSRKWSERWPQGLAVPNPDIPNRDPFLQTAAHELRANMEALHPREPFEIWPAREGAARALAGMSEFIAASDVDRLDQWLLRQPSSTAEYESACNFLRGEDDTLDLDCTGAFALQGRLYLDADEIRKGRIDRLAIGNSEIRDLQVESAGPESLRLKRGNISARLRNGNAIEHLHLAWRQDSGSAWQGKMTLAVREDFKSLRASVAQVVEQKHDALSANPFRRAVVMHRIIPSHTGPPRPAEMAPPKLDAVVGGPITNPSLRPFVRWCANCHRSNDRFPPNFLSGNAAAVEAKLEHCAERIYARLALHDLPEHERAKTPMPPAFARDGLETEELNALRDYAANLIKVRRGKVPPLDELLLPGYENLRECLPR